MDPALIAAILDYVWRVTPGLLVIIVTYGVLPKQALLTRIFLLIFAFLLVRDAMTPVGFWQLGVYNHVIWLRFADHALLLIILGAISLLMTLLVMRFNPELNRYLVWFGKNKIFSLFIGLAASIVVVAPVYLMYLFIPLEERGGPVTASLLIPLLFLALCGNWLEEVLFRGYLQGYLTQRTGAKKAVLLSGLLFAVGHVFLSATVTGPRAGDHFFAIEMGAMNEMNTKRERL